MHKVQTDWIKGAHEPLEGFDEALWERVQATRDRHRHRVVSTRRAARTYRLTGLATCHVCGGNVGIMGDNRGRPRLVCRDRLQKKTACANSLTYLSTYETQISTYLEQFQIPDDVQDRLLRKAEVVVETDDNREHQRQTLAAKLERIQKLYRWGDLTESAYLSERAGIQQQLSALAPVAVQQETVEASEATLRRVRDSWDVADQDERNRLARTLFEDIRVQGHQVVGVRPRAEFAPFFRLNDEHWKAKEPANRQQALEMYQGRKRRGSVPYLRTGPGPVSCRLPVRRCAPAPTSA